MKTFLIGAAVAALLAAPAQAQLLGGGLGGMVGGSVGGAGSAGPLPLPGDTIGTVTRGTIDGAARTSGSHEVDRRSGKVRAERKAEGRANGSASHATTVPGGALLGGASGSVVGSGSGSADAQLIGTDAVRGTVASLAGTARGAGQGAVGHARSTTGALVGTAGSLGAGAQAAGSGAASGGFGQLAAAGSIAAVAQGAFAVDKGMPVLAPDGDRVGKVREILTDARGHVRALVVTVDGARATLPAANFAGRGDVLVSAMSEAQLEQVAERQEQAARAD